MERYYRYIDSYPVYDGEVSNVYCREFSVAKKTEKGAWIRSGSYGKKRFVLDRGKKKYAYPTKKEAFKSFVIRKRRHMQHVEYTHDHLVSVLKLIETAEQSETPNVEYIENNNATEATVSLFDLKLNVRKD